MVLLRSALLLGFAAGLLLPEKPLPPPPSMSWGTA